MAARVCAFEFFHNAPSVDDLREVVRKHLTWHHRRTARGSLPIAALWVVCASRPDAALRALGARRCPRWPRGVYAVSTALTAMRVVVLGELDRDRDTLTLRLMGRDAVLDQAMREFDSLPRGSRERAVAGAVVDFMERRRKEPAMSPRTDYLRKKVQDLLDEGRVEGRVEGLAPLTHVFERRLQRALTDTEHATIRARLDQVGPTRLGDVVLDLDAESLARWIHDPDAR